VIESAPKVAQGAKKLWNTVGKKPAAAPATAHGQSNLSESAPTLVALQAQVVALQVTTAELHQQMLDSSALIGALAEQNAQLIARLEVNRKRVLGLAAVLLSLTAVMAVKLF
jgi:hypothetical protein